MRNKGRLLTLAVTLLLVAYAIYYLLVGYGLSILILLALCPIIWWLGKSYDELHSRYEQLAKREDELDENLTEIKRKINEYEILFDSLDGAVFTLDLQNNYTYFSKGFESIYGYKVADFMNRPSLWKEVIHPDDYGKVEENEQEMLTGHSSRINFRIIHPEIGEKWVSRIATPVQDTNGTNVKINGQMIDITEQKKLEEKLKQMAYYDDLTDLPNRKLLDRHIGKALARSKRHHHNFSIMFIDLDDFKKVNDTMGHDAGDILLKEVVKRLNESLREEDLIARIGGDEFVVVFEETNKEEIEDIAERIVHYISLPYTINDQEAKISLSIGISMFPDDGEDKETLIEHADKAMYFAKNNGKNNYKLYTPDLNDLEVKKMGIFEKWMNTIQNSKLFH